MDKVASQSANDGPERRHVAGSRGANGLSRQHAGAPDRTGGRCQWSWPFREVHHPPLAAGTQPVHVERMKHGGVKVVSESLSVLSFLLELAVYAGLMTGYFFLVLHFLGGALRGSLHDEQGRLRLRSAGADRRPGRAPANDHHASIAVLPARAEEKIRHGLRHLRRTRQPGLPGGGGLYRRHPGRILRSGRQLPGRAGFVCRRGADEHRGRHRPGAYRGQVHRGREETPLAGQRGLTSSA